MVLSEGRHEVGAETHHCRTALSTTFGISFVIHANISSWVVRWSGKGTNTLG
jgi:hypothetical protein